MRRRMSTLRDRGPAADTGFESAPGIVLLLFCLLTSVVAHTQAGGSAPGPGGLLVTGLVLAPIALAANSLARGPIAYIVAGLIGQLAAHVSLSIVTPGHHAAGHVQNTAPSVGAHGTHHQVPIPTAAPDWSFHDAVFGHIVHMGAGMATAHVLGALATAWLVSAGLAGLRRAAGQVLTVVLRIAVPRTPVLAAFPNHAEVAATKEPFLVVLGGRAPPALS